MVGNGLAGPSKMDFVETIRLLNHYAPLSFHDIWTKNSVIQGERPLRNADDFQLPIPRTELFKKSPLYTLPLEWNNMDDTKFIRNRTTFKTAVKFNLLTELIDGMGS